MKIAGSSLKPLVHPGSAGVSPATVPTQRIGWHSRGYIPHFDQPALVQSVTFRLADALPSSTIQQLGQDLVSRNHPERRRRLESYLDSGHGECLLRDPCLARLVEGALLRFDNTRYHLLAWVVMPNHVHVLIETLPGHPLQHVVHSWKSYTAKQACQLLNRHGRFWQPEYFDRAIRDERHLATAVEYILNNPVKAGLARTAEDWPFSSAMRYVLKDEAGETPALPGRTSRAESVPS